MGEVRDEVASVIVTTERIRSSTEEPEVSSAARQVEDDFRHALAEMERTNTALWTQVLAPSIAHLRELYRRLDQRPELYRPFLVEIERAGRAILNAMPGHGRTPGRFP